MSRYYYLGPWVWQEADPENQLTEHYRAPSGTIGLVDLRPLSPTLAYGFFATDQEIADSNYEPFGDGVNRLEDVTISEVAKNRWSSMLGIGPIAGEHLIDALWETLTLYGDPDGGAMCPPLMPTHLGVLELHLGGHSLIRSEQFTGPAHPAWPRIQALIQRNYRRIRTEAMRTYRGPGEPTLHRKYLECMRRKLRCPVDMLIPADLPKEKPIKPTTTISDDFNRADGTDMGADWTEVLGDWSIASNKATTSTDNGTMRHNTALSSDDHYAQMKTNFAGAGPMVRFSSSANTGYAWGTHASLGILKIVAGVVTVLYDGDVSVGDGSTCKLTANGSSLETFDDGVSVGSVTDTAISGNTQCGCYMRYNRNIDDFYAEDLVVVTPDTSLFDGKIIIKSSATSLYDGRVQIKSIDTSLYAGKLVISSIDTSLYAGKVTIKSAEVTAYDGKIVIKDTATAQYDGRLKVTLAETGLFDGKLIVQDTGGDATAQFDGKVRVKSHVASLFDGKCYVALLASGNITVTWTGARPTVTFAGARPNVTWSAD